MGGYIINRASAQKSLKSWHVDKKEAHDVEPQKRAQLKEYKSNPPEEV